MVRIWVASDLHVNAYPWSPRLPPHDLLVIAGDVSDGPRKAAEELVRLHGLTGKPILFVPGNHDFMGGSLRTGEFNHLPKKVAVLEAGQSVVLDGVRFIGATLWTDFGLTDTEFASQKWAIGAMPEYCEVRHSEFDRFIWPIDVAGEHDRDRKALDQALRTPHEGTTVVLTHHAPSIRSLPKDAQQDISGAAFASDLEALIQLYQPDLWIHGHIHEPADYRIGHTRILSNPRGYPNDLGSTTPWREQLVVDVP